MVDTSAKMLTGECEAELRESKSRVGKIQVVHSDLHVK